MAVPEQTPYKEYTANGITKIFPLEFDVLEQDHLIVLVNDLEPSVGSWSLDALNDTVVFVIPPANGANIKIRRDTPMSRSTDYQTYNNSFRPEPVNKDLDNIWRKLQEMGVLNWMVDNNIKDLGDYVDSLNDETKAQFLAEIQKQGISLSQLENLTNQIYKNLANIATEKGWFAEFVTTKTGENQQQVNDWVNTALPYSANNFDTLQDSVDNSPSGNHIEINTGLYKQNIDLNKINIKGKGYGTIVSVVKNNYGIKSLQTTPNWDKMRIADIAFQGQTLTNTIGFQFDPNDPVSGRRNIEYCTFENLDIAISKPTGNIGNTYSNLNIFNCNYGVKASSVWEPMEMHSGNDTWRDFQIDTISTWAFDYVDKTGGGAIHIKDGIIEYCQGGGIRLEYSDDYPPFIPPRISNVWFEQIALANSVVRDGVTEVPRTIKLVNTAMCLIENCKLDNIELVNSTAIASKCRIDSKEILIDKTSNLIIEEAFMHGSVPKNITVKSIAKQSYPSAIGGNLTLRGTDIVGVKRIPQGASAAVGVTFTGNVGKKWALDGTSLVYAESLFDDNGAECAYLNLDKNKINILEHIVTPANHWVVWGISAKQVGDVTGTFQFNYDYNLGDIILEKDKWVHSFGIAKAPPIAMRIGAKFTPTSDMALKLKNYFIASFEKESDALAFANSRMAIDTHPKSVQIQYDPPQLVAGEMALINIDCLGVSPVDNLSCSFSNPLNGIDIWTEVTDNNVINFYMKNTTANTINLVPGILSIKVL